MIFEIVAKILLSKTFKNISKQNARISIFKITEICVIKSAVLVLFIKASKK